jgi:hypothetical protein
MTYDPERPGGYQDADIEQAELQAAARHEAAVRRRGVCTHGSWQGHTERHRPDLEPGEVECLDCHVRFPDERALWDERVERLS